MLLAKFAMSAKTAIERHSLPKLFPPTVVRSHILSCDGPRSVLNSPLAHSHRHTGAQRRRVASHGSDHGYH